MTDENVETTHVVSQASKIIVSILNTLNDQPLPLKDPISSDLPKLLLPWADHILTGKKINESTVDSGKRDWAGLSNFFKDYRDWEVQGVNESANSLREFIWQFLRSISDDVTANKIDTSTINHTMHKLESALSSDSLDDLKQEVGTVVQVLKEKSFEREKRYNEQLAMLGRRLKHMRDELEKTKERLGTDALTGIYNRAALDEQLHRILDIGILSGSPTCLLMIDIDHFKEVNDSHGHPVGDIVLQKIAEVLKKIFPRKSDFVARYGGEEFTVIFSEDDAKIGKMLAEKLIAAIRDLKISLSGGQYITVTVSVGVAEKKSSETIEEWVKRADDALYQAKDMGRDRVCLAL